MPCSAAQACLERPSQRLSHAMRQLPACNSRIVSRCPSHLCGDHRSGPHRHEVGIQRVRTEVRTELLRPERCIESQRASAERREAASSLSLPLSPSVPLCSLPLSPSAAIPRSNMPTPPPMFASDLTYYVGTWRRTPYDVSSWPQSLNANNGTAVCLGGYDTETGNLWKVLRCREDAYILQCDEVGESKFLGADLRMKSEQADAAVWTAESCPGFRNGPYDVAVKFKNEYGQVLCSCDQTKQVALLAPQEAEEIDNEGCFMWNNAWECTPDLDSNEEDEFLNKYMNYTEFK